MRKLLPLVLGAALVSLAAVPVKKKSGKAGARTAIAKKGKKVSAPAPAAARSRQLVPTPDRYKQIQEALAAKGYLPAQQANGQWNDASAEALKRFQADQNLDATGKINSLSLIALGLGPKHETAPPPAP